MNRISFVTLLGGGLYNILFCLGKDTVVGFDFF